MLDACRLLTSFDLITQILVPIYVARLVIGEGTDSAIFRAYHYKQGPPIHAMEASRVMEEWMDIVESVGGLSNLSRKTRSSFSNRRRDRNNNSSLRRSAPPEAFNIAPNTCDLENLSSHQNMKTSGKSSSFATRQSLVKQSLLEALGDLALDDEVDTEEIIDEHENEISLPSQLAEYYREHSTRRKSGRKVATTNLAALQEIVAKSSKTTTSSNANVRCQQHSHPVLFSADMATEPTNHDSSAALEAMSGHLGQNIEWESELNQAVLDDIAASFREDKKKSESANESSSSSFEIPEQQDQDLCEKNNSCSGATMQRSGSLKSFVKHFSFVKQISANLASECTESTTDAISESLGSSFPQLSLDTPAVSARTPETIPATYQDSLDAKRSDKTSNSSYLHSEHSVDITSMDAQDSCQAPSGKGHRPTKRASMGMVGLEIIVETPNENGTVASKSKASCSEAAHTMSTVRWQNKATRGKSPSVPLEIPQEIEVKAPSPTSSQKAPARNTSPCSVSSSTQPMPLHRAAAIDNEKMEPPTPLPPSDDACTSTRFGTLHQPWPELRVEDSYRQKVESGAAVRESKIHFISRQVSSRLAGEL